MIPVGQWDIPPNVTALLVAFVAAGGAGFLTNHLSKKRGDQRAEKITQAVSDKVEEQATRVAYESQNGALRSAVNNTLARMMDLELGLREFRSANDLAHKDLLNRLETHFVAFGHPDEFEWLMRVIEEFRGTEGVRDARALMAQVQEESRERAIARAKERRHDE